MGWSVAGERRVYDRRCPLNKHPLDLQWYLSRFTFIAFMTFHGGYADLPRVGVDVGTWNDLIRSSILAS